MKKLFLIMLLCISFNPLFGYNGQAHAEGSSNVKVAWAAGACAIAATSIMIGIVASSARKNVNERQ